jgi:hypothetical protein
MQYSSLECTYTVSIGAETVGLLLLGMTLRLEHDYGALQVGRSRPPAVSTPVGCCGTAFIDGAALVQHQELIVSLASGSQYTDAIMVHLARCIAAAGPFPAATCVDASSQRHDVNIVLL